MTNGLLHPDLGEVQFTRLGPWDDYHSYVAVLRDAFNFISRCDNGRYSSRSKMKIQNAAIRAEAEQSPYDLDLDYYPIVMTLSKTPSFDEDTEVKTGGTAGVAVVWASDNGRFLLATAPLCREKGVAATLLDEIQRHVPQAMTWVGQTNSEAQRVLLRRGFVPSALNSSGAVCYTLHGGMPNDVGQDGFSDPEPPSRYAEAWHDAPLGYEETAAAPLSERISALAHIEQRRLEREMRRAMRPRPTLSEAAF